MRRGRTGSSRGPACARGRRGHGALRQWVAERAQEVLRRLLLGLLGLVEHRGRTEEVVHDTLVVPMRGGYAGGLHLPRELPTLAAQDVPLGSDHQRGGQLREFPAGPLQQVHAQVLLALGDPWKACISIQDRSARFSGRPSAASSIDSPHCLPVVSGYTQTTALGTCSPACASCSTVAGAMFPPPDSPPIPVRDGSPPNSAACSAVHRYAARTSSCEAGKTASGARR